VRVACTQDQGRRQSGTQLHGSVCSTSCFSQPVTPDEVKHERIASMDVMSDLEKTLKTLQKRFHQAVDADSGLKSVVTSAVRKELDSLRGDLTGVEAQFETLEAHKNKLIQELQDLEKQCRLTATFRCCSPPATVAAAAMGAPAPVRPAVAYAGAVTPINPARVRPQMETQCAPAMCNHRVVFPTANSVVIHGAHTIVLQPQPATMLSPTAACRATAPAQPQIVFSRTPPRVTAPVVPHAYPWRATIHW